MSPELQNYIEQVKKRADRATPGPWISNLQNPFGMSQHHRWTIDGNAANQAGEPTIVAEEVKFRNHEFIAEARTDIPTLIKLVEMAIQTVDKMDCTCGSEGESDYSYKDGGCDKHQFLQDAAKLVEGSYELR